MALHASKFSELTGLAFDKTDSLFTGEIATYPVTIQYVPRRNLTFCRVICKDPNNRSAAEIQQHLDNFRMNRSGVSQIYYKNRALTAVVSVPSRKPDEGTAETLRALVELAAYLEMIPCCEGCGAEYGWRYYALDGAGVVICDSCRSFTERNMADIRETAAQERPNVGGQILGMLIGAAALFLLTYGVLRLGYVTYLTGYVGMLIGFLAMKKLGKKLTIPAAIVAIVIGLAVAAFTPILSISKDIAEFNTENYADFAKFNAAYTEIVEATRDMTAEEKKEAEEYLGATLSELKERHETYTEAMENTDTMDCLTHFGALWKNDLYSDIHGEVIKCILWGVLSIIIGSAVTLPAMLREAGGIHKLRELAI